MATPPMRCRSSQWWSCCGRQGEATSAAPGGPRKHPRHICENSPTNPIHRAERGVTVTSTRPLKIGLQLPTWEAGLSGRTPRWADLLSLSQRAEAVGFDSLWVVDHAFARDSEFFERLGVPIPPELVNDRALGYWEGFVLLAAIASATSRVDLGTL